MPPVKRATIYFQPKVYRALKIKSAVTDRPLSALVNEAVAYSLEEDKADREALRKRAKEPSEPLHKVIAELRRDGLL